ncbi:VOC family protein [Candidatus Mycobacterium wuenschmannii]|uniref:VOC family protein n=1 Tax=Candidatus Mycobacterium wuenschmannii TaxID=3027808 RepID=A0ABY8VTG0_9MYCO|nr:VOC family protein [Candidatus Mycobacterium wuenschmannii]WIM86320.1 VOC family protein [Candidatus Mycobacterium wuenschmannii]
MAIEHVLAAVPVTDLDRSRQWYESLFGRPADNNPMSTLCEWQVVPGGWVQVFVNEQCAGSSFVNFAAQDLEAEIEELKQRGLEMGEITDAAKGVRLSALTDPDGNTVTLIGGFRVQY